MTAELSILEAPVERAGGAWSYVSASRLNLWLKCPLAFQLRYVDGVETPPTPSLFLGKQVHAALECYYRHRQLGVSLAAEALAAKLARSWDERVAEERMVFASLSEEVACRRQADGLVAAYLRHVASEEARPLAVEAALEAPLVDPATGEDFGMPLVGVVDLVLAGHTGPLIVDFKTGSRGGQPLEIAHEIQLSAYSYLFRSASPEREAGLEIRSLVKTKVPQVQFHPYPAADERRLRRLFAVVRAYLDDLHSGRFVFRPGLGCSMCDYRETHCRQWCG